ncbi:hypothetical protein YC2023_088059 [Brassica napus]
MRLASFVVVMFGVFPLMCGWLLDVCTVTMFGQTMSYRLQFLSVSPLASSLVHWVVGAVYDWYSLIFENLLREDNRNDEPGRQNIEQVLHVVEPDMAMAAHPAPDDPKRSLLQE